MSHTISSTQSGRKITAAAATTGKAVVSTGKAVGGAIYNARSSISSWWHGGKRTKMEEENEEEDSNSAIETTWFISLCAVFAANFCNRLLPHVRVWIATLAISNRVAQLFHKRWSWEWDLVLCLPCLGVWLQYWYIYVYMPAGFLNVHWQQLRSFRCPFIVYLLVARDIFLSRTTFHPASPSSITCIVVKRINMSLPQDFSTRTALCSASHSTSALVSFPWYNTLVSSFSSHCLFLSLYIYVT